MFEIFSRFPSFHFHMFYVFLLFHDIVKIQKNPTNILLYRCMAIKFGQAGYTLRMANITDSGQIVAD